MTLPILYHLFPGHMEHHVLDMIEYFEDYANAPGLADHEQIHVVFGTDPQHRPAYERLNVPDHRLLFYPTPDIRVDFLKRVRQTDVMIIHSAHFPRIWLTLIRKPALWKRTAMINWGAGFSNSNATHWKGRINAMLRRTILPKLGALSTLTPGEFEQIERDFGPCHNYVRAIYSSISCRDTEIAETPSPHAKRVMVGHSSDEYNGHVQVLEWLGSHGSDGLEVICPLGYPTYNEALSYRKRVLEAGQQALGGSFQPLLEMIPKKPYRSLLDRIDVFISNSQVQQGLYHVYYMLCHGKKLFIRRDCPIFEMLVDHDIIVCDTLEIPSLSRDQIVTQDPDARRHNIKRARECWSREAVIEGWIALVRRIARQEKTTPCVP